ncbi:MAG: MFS transporter [Micromonosporaceae bacterium]
MIGPRPATGRVTWMHLATLVLSIGSGAWFSSWTIFFTRSVGLSAVEFGLGITVAGVIGLVGGSPFGYLADRLGTREALVGLGAVQGVAILSYMLVESFWAFFAVTTVAVTAERLAPGIRIAVISGLTSGATRLRDISTNRVVQHVGLAVGAGIGALILWADTRPAYLGLILLYGLAILGSAAIVLLRVPRVASLVDRRDERRMLALRDRPFLVVTLLSGVLALNWGMLGVGLPLWINAHTNAPLWTVGAITAFNALVIILLQNRVSRSADTVPRAARMAVRSGVTLAVACAIFAATYHGSGALVIALLFAGAAVHVAGELFFVASGWGLSVGLTPREAHGEYQSTFATGSAAALVVAPAVMSATVAGWGVAGWAVLGVLFLLAALPVVPVSRWALRAELRAEVAAA